MSLLLSSRADDVGPVLSVGRVTDAVVAALEALNPDVSVISRGGYIRVRVARRCVLTSSEVEAALGEPFVLPGDLEAIMPSFVGKLTIRSGSVEWAL